jgi:two-component system, NarL family, nitrate/nitrite response regulator NarL
VSTDDYIARVADPTSVMLLIVDDHDGFRSFARVLFAGDGFEVAGDAADGESALEAAQALHPDVVLLDVQLPGIDGFEVARRLAASADAPAVVLTSTRQASDFGRRLTEAPVRGFIPKQDLSAESLAAVLAG